MGQVMPCLKNSQDGGDGHVGTVVEVGHIGNRLSPDKTVIVQWDNGRRTNYRVGYKGAYDLLVFDGAPSGVKHCNKRCDGCGRRGIKGIRWQCTQCEDYDLCTRCYMDNVHNIQHKFRRFLTNKSTGVLIPKRAKCTRTQSNGIFPGAKVTRGYDWVWGDQDGGNSNLGTITDTRGWQNESESSVASITWPGNKCNLYRVGHRGKVDVKYVTPGNGPMYYKEHLPVLGKDEVDPALVPTVEPCPFAVGDRVRVTLPVEVLKLMQKGHGGWNPKMAALVDKIGVVHRITQAGDVRVQYRSQTPTTDESSTSGPTTSENNRWTFNQAALTRVRDDGEGHRFIVNDQVRVIDEYDAVKSLQSSEHGNWNEKMAESLGQKGVIVEVYRDGDVRVDFPCQRQWTFNPACLMHVPPRKRNAACVGTSKDSPSPLSNGTEHTTDKRGAQISADIVNKASIGDLKALKQLFHLYPNMVDAQFRGRTALHAAAFKGHAEVLRFLLRKKATISKADDEGDNAIHYAMCGKNDDCVRLVLSESTSDDVNRVNSKKLSPLHVSVVQNNEVWARHTLERGCNVNLQDTVGDTAAHDCVINHDNGEMVRLLTSQPNFDPELLNSRELNILHLAAQRGRTEALKCILAECPDLPHVKKNDDGCSALHLSALNNRIQVTRILVNKCPFLIDQVDAESQTPLFFACLGGHVQIVDILVGAGVAVDARRADGRTCLRVTLEKYVETANELLHDANCPTNASESSAIISSSVDTYLSDLTFGTSTQWNEVRNILIRHGLASAENLVHLAISCYLVRSGADISLINGNLLGQLGTRSRAALLECEKYKIAMLSCELAKIVQLTDEPAPRKLASPSPSAVENSIPWDSRPSYSRISPQKEKSSVQSTNNFVKGLDDEKFDLDYTSSRECMSCDDEQACVVFRPCGHRVVCLECCVRMKKCILCHRTISTKVDHTGKDLSIPQMSTLSVNVEQQKTVLNLEKKVRELQESNQCIICMERQRDTALRCGHRFCQKCSISLRKQCPICRKPITGTIRLY